MFLDISNWLYIVNIARHTFGYWNSRKLPDSIALYTSFPLLSIMALLGTLMPMFWLSSMYLKTALITFFGTSLFLSFTHTESYHEITQIKFLILDLIFYQILYYYILFRNITYINLHPRPELNTHPLKRQAISKQPVMGSSYSYWYFGICTSTMHKFLICVIRPSYCIFETSWMRNLFWQDFVQN